MYFNIKITKKRPTENCRSFALVRLAGLEPARALAHHPLKMACLPFHHNRMEYKWCLRTESNCRHTDFQSVALPTELPRHVFFVKKNGDPDQI